jgi:hypothetical protein
MNDCHTNGHHGNGQPVPPREPDPTLAPVEAAKPALKPSGLCDPDRKRPRRTSEEIRQAIRRAILMEDDGLSYPDAYFIVETAHDVASAFPELSKEKRLQLERGLEKAMLDALVDEPDGGKP